MAGNTSQPSIKRVWSNEDIAADIRAEPEQVRQCIYYQKYKKKSPSGADGEEQT